MINRPTSDFVSTAFDVVLAQGETGSITAKIGTGLSIPASNSFLQVDYNSTDAVGDPNGPETIFYAAYNSGTGALTGVVRGQAGTTDVTHDAGAEVQCGMTTAFLEDNTGWKTVKDTWAYASATTITVPAGAASLYSVGDKIKITQTTDKFFYIVGVADTVLTVCAGSDYTVANEAITAAYYSKATSPVGFPFWFAFSTTYGGFSSNPPSTNLQFGMNGREVKLLINTGDGTSNATSFTMTAPVASAKIAGGTINVKDNGNWSGNAPGVISINAGTSISIYLIQNLTNNFTNSGAKAAFGEFTYGA